MPDGVDRPHGRTLSATIPVSVPDSRSGRSTSTVIRPPWPTYRARCRPAGPLTRQVTGAEAWLAATPRGGRIATEGLMPLPRRALHAGIGVASAVHHCQLLDLPAKLRAQAALRINLGGDAASMKVSRQPERHAASRAARASRPAHQAPTAWRHFCKKVRQPPLVAVGPALARGSSTRNALGDRQDAKPPEVLGSALANALPTGSTCRAARARALRDLARRVAARVAPAARTARDEEGVARPQREFASCCMKQNGPSSEGGTSGTGCCVAQDSGP